MTPEERRIYRQQNYRSEIKRAGNDSFEIITAGNETQKNDGLAALNAIRHIIWPELDHGLRLDKTVETVIRKSDSPAS